MQKIIKGQAIIISSREYGEADRILTLLTEDAGKLSVIAKGSRKPTSRKRGHLEIFSKIRFTTARSRGFSIITEVDPLDLFGRIRNDLKKASVAYFFVEVAARITREGEAVGEVYAILSSYLDRLKTEERLKSLRNSYSREILTQVGFWPPDRPLADPDEALEAILERKLGSIRVGRKITA